MAGGNLVAVTSHGLFSSGGGTCDYPDEYDVRDGVQYDSGALVGTLTLPSEDEVLAGVEYGGDGDEFTGTLGVIPPVPPTVGSSPFAAIASAIKTRLAISTGVGLPFVNVVATDKYRVTLAEDFFLYVQFFSITQPKDPALNFIDAGAGRLARPVARRCRVYVYTRSGVDSYGDDTIALFGANPSQTVETPPTFPGQFVAEEVVLNCLDDWLPVDVDDNPLTLGPIHVLDASEEPQRPSENESGLLRSCLDFEICYILAIGPTEPAP